MRLLAVCLVAVGTLVGASSAPASPADAGITATLITNAKNATGLQQNEYTLSVVQSGTKNVDTNATSFAYTGCWFQDRDGNQRVPDLPGQQQRDDLHGER